MPGRGESRMWPTASGWLMRWRPDEGDREMATAKVNGVVLEGEVGR